MSIAYPSTVAVPKQFTILSNVAVPCEGGVAFQMLLSCTCGKQPYVNVRLDGVEELATERFWKDVWQHMLVHEKAETLAEGGTWVD